MIHSKTYIAIPPGETIKEQLELRGMSREEFSARLGFDATDLLEGRARLTSDTARRLESVLGVPAEFWKNLEAGYNEMLIKVEEENSRYSAYRAG